MHETRWSNSFSRMEIRLADFYHSLRKPFLKG